MVKPGELEVDLSGTVSFVLGGSSGIGNAVAAAFAEAGSTVVVGSRRLPIDLRRRNAAADADIYEIRCDITDLEGMSNTYDRIADELGVPTVVVNSPGAVLHKPALEVTPDEWDALHSVQLRGVFFSCQKAARLMAPVGYGKIVNIGSTWGTTVATGRSVYAAAKAGLAHLGSALALEWASHGIRVNTVAPAATVTEGLLERLEGDPDREGFLTARIPLGRLATVDDVTGAVLFLASASSDFVTGTTLQVDGGWQAAK